MKEFDRSLQYRGRGLYCFKCGLPPCEHMIAIAVLISTAEGRAFIAGVAYLSKMCYMEPVSFGMVDVVWRPGVCVRRYVI